MGGRGGDLREQLVVGGGEGVHLVVVQVADAGEGEHLLDDDTDDEDGLARLKVEAEGYAKETE